MHLSNGYSCVACFKVDSQFYNESLWKCIEIKPNLLDSLVRFHIEKNNTIEEQLLDHRLFRFLLEKSTNLREVSSAINFDDGDAVFENLKINAPLTRLKLTNITDSSFEAIIQLAKTLQTLILHRCVQITNDG